MAKHKNKHSHIRTLALLALGMLGLTLTIIMLLMGSDVALFNPKGMIAQKELNLILFTSALLLAFAVPTLFILYSFAWKYREGTEHESLEPDSRHSKLAAFCMWAIPIIFVMLLAPVMWSSTHKLEPQKTIASETKPITIQVVAMRWKWLFIYPEQNIATVNFVQIPVDTPVQFDLTADETPMSSFWIPHLSGQLYAMTGHVNRLNLIADQPGDYPGSTAEINGRGFAGMKFTTRATNKEDFDRWVQSMKASSTILSDSEYAQLLKPSENNESAFYSSVQPDLYAKMLMKYEGSHDHPTETQESSGH